MRAGQPGPVPVPERASDHDRERAIAELRERSVAGEISHDTFVRRIDVALRARSRKELAALLADLPPGRLGRRLLNAVEHLSMLSARLGTAWRTPRLRLSLCLPQTGLTLPRFTLPRDPPAAGTSPVFTIGREPGCDLVIPDLTVSRLHAELTHLGDQWLLCDHGSMNGTRCNGWRITAPVPVHAGDVLTFGTVTFIVA